MKSLLQYIKENLYEHIGYPIMEMSQINTEDKSDSPFPWNKYKLYVYADDHNPAHFHIQSRQEGFDIRIDIENASLISVKKYGKRKRTDNFNDIVKLAKEWLSNKSSDTGFKDKTNKEMTIYNWNVNNPERKI